MPIEMGTQCMQAAKLRYRGSRRTTLFTPYRSLKNSLLKKPGVVGTVAHIRLRSVIPRVPILHRTKNDNPGANPEFSGLKSTRSRRPKAAKFQNSN